MLAIIEANRLGQLRTGAASGLATRHLARADSTRLGVIGTGYQARTQIEAICAVRPISQVSVWGRDRGRLERFCADVGAALKIRVDPVASAHDAVASADVVATMTSSSTPVFAADSLAPGTHINAAGSNRPTACELDVETIRRADLVAVEDLAQAQVEAGELLAAVAAGAFAWTSAVRLADIVSGQSAGRTRPDAITLFESLGVGLWDNAVASHVYDACLRAGRGTPLPFPG
jgi:ornithine cyclodeaminase/alanine dehydrogenase-like protein (mu-crystallin family)